MRRIRSALSGAVAAKPRTGSAPSSAASAPSSALSGSAQPASALSGSPASSALSPAPSVPPAPSPASASSFLSRSNVVVSSSPHPQDQNQTNTNAKDDDEETIGNEDEEKEQEPEQEDKEQEEQEDKENDNDDDDDKEENDKEDDDDTDTTNDKMNKMVTAKHVLINNKPSVPTQSKNMKGLGKFSYGGKGKHQSMVRHRKVLRDNIKGITKPAIRRLARRGGVKRLSGMIYEPTRNVLKVFLEETIRDAVTYTEHAHRKTVTTMDVVYSLKRRGRTLYGFGG